MLKGELQRADIPEVTRVSRAARNDDGMMGVLPLGKLAIALGIIGVFGYDGFSVMSNNVSTENQAQDAAYAASQAWHDSSGNLQVAYRAATQAVAGTTDTVLQQGFSVDPDGTIHLLLRHTAPTVVFQRIGFLKQYVVTTQQGDANSVN